MSVYIKLSTLEYPRYQGDIRIEYPNIGDEFICPETYSEVDYISPPEIDIELQYCYEEMPRVLDGKWTMVWGIKDLTEEEKAEREKQKQRNPLNKSGTEPNVIG